MPSFGAAKTPMASAARAEKVTPIHGESGESVKRAGEIGEKFHAAHHKMAGHIASIQKHVAGMLEAHAQMASHLSTMMPGKSGVSKAEPTEGDEDQE